MEAPKFEIGDLVEAAVEVTEEYREEHDDGGRVDRDGEIATEALSKYIQG